MGSRGRLRVYLGAAPGVGKTYAMLGEARRRLERGTDVVVGVVETHGRVHTEEMLAGLEVVPRVKRTHRGVELAEMDVEAVLRRHPEVALVDELAHTNVPGGRHDKRWQDVEELLDAGIDVVTTVNIQHLESVNDVVEQITGVAQRETVPDAVVRAADQIELKDMAGASLRRRLAHGNIYAPEKIDAALGSYFRLGNLEALREIALLWTADRVDDALQRYRADHDIDRTWETRERVVVALTGGAEGETLVRRAARIANRAGGELLALHVTRSDGLVGVDAEKLAHQRTLVESLGGSYHQVLGDDVPQALLSFARAENATQLVLGDSRRSRLVALLTGPGIGTSVIRSSGDIDVHIVTHRLAGAGRFPRRRGAVSSPRRLAGFGLAVLLPALLTGALVPLRGDNLVTDAMLFLLLTVVVSVVGGTLPALLAAVVGSMLLNFFFTPPLHTLTIADGNNALALGVFLLVAVLVSSVVDLAARRTREAARSSAESRTLADLAAASLGGDDAVGNVLERLRETLGLTSVSLCDAPDSSADTCVPAGPDRYLLLRGRILEADEQRMVGAFADQVAALVDRARLRQEASEAGVLAAGNRMRTALLAAVGHDLRTPLAAAKASVSSLRAADIALDDADRDELLAAADESLDRLAALVDNLLDMSRLQTGAMTVRLEPTGLEEVVARALDDLGPDGRRVRVEVPPDLPPALADPGLLERVVANVVGNALRYAPADRPPLLTGSAVGSRVEIRVVDRGPGIPAAERDRVFRPFQRLGDTDNTTGLGLGLALSRGLAEGMGGTLEPEETPGGGLTMVLALPAADSPEVPEPGRRERARR
ncbi:DUF4118 domain-containing protein [Nocardioides mangrovicus]|uniref:DUF4118 domain-containing protein n=1 Tax=Nocardioides mangrovicus TaxID=2478913 RepID=UPI0018E09F7F|nr:DUF4118 domain-containing protein [Nocardioides mangrovicus]